MSEGLSGHFPLPRSSWAPFCAIINVAPYDSNLAQKESPEAGFLFFKKCDGLHQKWKLMFTS
jgi:hypothetical protein